MPTTPMSTTASTSTDTTTNANMSSLDSSPNEPEENPGLKIKSDDQGSPNGNLS